jgi:hypothetical protein
MPADPLPQPTVEQIESALDQLLTAIVEHDRRRAEAEAGAVSYPGKNFIDDPIGHALRDGVTKLGKCLFACTGSLAALEKTCERVAARDPAYWALRADIIDKWWDGIGDERGRWAA